ncbi:hypothetical protein I4U23_027780 [Adineta vaga]|nr:hypothetical protein I4U23_027780 [Adineta vaga]
MVEPVTVIVLAINVISFIKFGIDLVKGWFRKEPSPTTIPSLSKITHSPTFIQSNLNTEYKSIKSRDSRRKENQSISSGLSLSIILFLGILLASIAYFIHRKRKQIDQSERRRNSLPSPPSSP